MMETLETSENSRYMTLPELSRERKLKLSWLYERSRRDKLPGQRRFGRLIRVNLNEFDAGVERGALA